MIISEKLQKYFDEYEESHKNKINLAIHKIAIPLIIFHIIAMLSWVHVINVYNISLSLAQFAMPLIFLFYVRLNKLYAFIMLIVFLFCFYLSKLTPIWVVCLIAALSWFIQLLGHAVWEKKSPAFSKNFLQLLIGPLFIINILFSKNRERNII
jgi:uncharacterized membrane protein YGL010W